MCRYIQSYIQANADVTPMSCLEAFPPSKRSITKVTPKSCLSLFPHLNACATHSKNTRNNGLNQALLW